MPDLSRPAMRILTFSDQAGAETVKSVNHPAPDSAAPALAHNTPILTWTQNRSAYSLDSPSTTLHIMNRSRLYRPGSQEDGRENEIFSPRVPPHHR